MTAKAAISLTSGLEDPEKGATLREWEV